MKIKDFQDVKKTRGFFNMVKVGKCITCGAHRILRGDSCKRCRSNGKGN